MLQDKQAQEKEAQKEAAQSRIQVLDPLRNEEFITKLVARLNGVEQDKLKDSFRETQPRAYYVIVGRGTAAIVNHTTLRQALTAEGKKRLQVSEADERLLPVIHVGGPDPWQEYHAHGMGQPPHLLNLPGYKERPKASSPTIRSGMRSRSFGELNAAETTRLSTCTHVLTATHWVAYIQKSDGADPVPKPEAKDYSKLLNGLEKEGLNKGRIDSLLKLPFHVKKAPYRLLVIEPDGWPRLLYAMKIDICSGAGRPRMLLEKDFPDGTTRLWRSFDTWDASILNRKVITAPEALFERTPWAADNRVCVNGTGGIGLNMIERSEDVGNTVDWLAGGLHNIAFNLPRNDTVLKDPATTQPMKPGTSKMRLVTGEVRPDYVPLIPCNENWRICTGVKVTGAVKGGNELTVTVVKDREKPHALDFSGARTEHAGTSIPFSPYYEGRFPNLAPEKFQLLFFSSGLDTNEAIGEPSSYAKYFTFKPIEVLKRNVGLETDDKLIRILGAAAQVFPDDPIEMNENPPGATAKYFLSLPMSAVAPGFIYTGINIALANGFFEAPAPSTKYNNNANTANEAELTQAITDTGSPIVGILPARLAAIIISRRRLANGFVSPTWSRREPLEILEESANTSTDPAYQNAVQEMIDRLPGSELDGISEQAMEKAFFNIVKTPLAKGYASIAFQALSAGDDALRKTVWRAIADHPEIKRATGVQVLVDKLPTEYRESGVLVGGPIS